MRFTRPRRTSWPRSAAEPGSCLLVEGVPVYLERLGSEPPVVVLHGASGNLRDWTFGPAQILAERHEVIVFDRPGHGLSGWPAGGERLAVQARLLRGALSALGIERTILIGHSYGGALALAWALDAPETVAGLLLLAAVSHDWDRRIGTLNSGMAIPFAGPPFAQALPALVSNGYIDRRLVQVFARIRHRPATSNTSARTSSSARPACAATRCSSPR